MSAAAPESPASLLAAPRVRLLLPTRTLAAIAAALTAVLMIGLLSYMTIQAMVASAESLAHTNRVNSRLAQTLSAIKDAETGQRGYLLTGDERYLQPYEEARRSAPEEIARVRGLVSDNVEQQRRLALLDASVGEKFAELAQTIALRRAGDAAAALALVRSDQGKLAMDRIRAIVDEMTAAENALLATRSEERAEVVRRSFHLTLGGAALILVMVLLIAMFASADFRSRETEAWLRRVQGVVAEQLPGDVSPQVLGERVLRALAENLDAQVGAVYARGEGGALERIAGHALGPEAQAHAVIAVGEGLAGQAARDRRLMLVRDLPKGYLHVRSASGSAGPQEVAIVPVVTAGNLEGVIELGFFRQVDEVERTLLERIAEPVAIALESARERKRRDELLEETQRQSEELQAQQEELRVSNEELEEQGRALRESQARLENQQAELEQINVSLEEQTERLQSQKTDLLRAQQDLERASRYKSEFLANMSHELRTPLNSSLILSKLLGDNAGGNLSEEQVRFANTIHSSNNDLLALINDILDLSKIEAGQVEVNAEAVDMAAIVDALRSLFEPIARDKGVPFRISAGGPGSLRVDVQKLQQVLKNLLSNAFKFTERGEVVLEISAPAPGRVAFAVRDSGIGIAEEQHAAIFEAFRQADGTTSRKYGGTGLGLSISRELARLLGGEIAVRSSPGAGSTFTLEIPVEWAGPAAAPRPAAAPAAKPQEAAPADSPHIDDDRMKRSRGQRLILVVEDDQRFAQVLYGLAHEMDFDCVHASTGEQALALARELQPTGVLLDNRLPDDSGLSLLARMKRDPQLRHIPVHMVSVEDHAKIAMELGAVGYALKPVARDEIVEAIGRIEARLHKRASRILVVEDDPELRKNIGLLLNAPDVEIVAVGTSAAALDELSTKTFDCMVTDLMLPDASGFELLEKMAAGERYAFPPVVVYTGRELTREEEQKLRRFSSSIIVKGARSPERLLDEVTLFLHRVESELPASQQKLLKTARQRDSAFEGRRILLAEDDVRNIFALSSILEPLGAKMELARNGREALEKLDSSKDIDLVLMDLMMPEMDGLTAMREIRRKPEHAKLSIIAITAKAMADDREACLAAGANDYIPKPIDVDKLVSLCRVWMPR